MALFSKEQFSVRSGPSAFVTPRKEHVAYLSSVVTRFWMSNAIQAWFSPYLQDGLPRRFGPHLPLQPVLP